MSDSALRVVGDEAAYAIITRKRAQAVTGVYPTKQEAIAWAESAAANAQHPAESVLRSLLERHAT